MSTDVVCLFGFFLTIVLAIALCFWVSRWPLRIACVLSAGAVCVGLSYFGWAPFWGGNHDVGTYFGTIMLWLGLMGFTITATMEQVFASPPL